MFLQVSYWLVCIVVLQCRSTKTRTYIMTKFTTNAQGYIDNVNEIVDSLAETYKEYVRELFTNKIVSDLSMNDMSFIRLVSSSSVLSMKKAGKTNLEILNSPVNKPSVAKSTPLTEDAVAQFLAKLSPEKRKQLLGG